MLTFLALGVCSALAHDPPGYARAFIGRVIGLPPEGVVVQGLDQSQLHPQPAPGVDHMCFMTGTALIKGLKTPYKVGDKIEIMVTEGDGTYLFADPTHPQQIEIWNLLSESLAFPSTSIGTRLNRRQAPPQPLRRQRLPPLAPARSTIRFPALANRKQRRVTQPPMRRREGA